MLLIVLVVLSGMAHSDNISAKSKPICDYSFKDSNACIRIEFKNGISRKSDSAFEVTFINPKTGKNIELKELPKSKLWMVMKNGHAHGSDEIEVTKMKNGVYLNKNVWFLMVGDWSLYIDAKIGQKAERIEIPVCVGKNSKKSFIGKCKS